MMLYVLLLSLLFQSTPPCGGRLYNQTLLFITFVVSIHAPVRGATVQVCLQLRPYCFNPRPRAGGDDKIKGVLRAPKKFQSTPPCGGRRWRESQNGGFMASFNPRPRAGGDTGCRGTRLAIIVSIHAPVRGATGRVWRSVINANCFNPRPRAGGDGDTVIAHHAWEAFQSTPPCGGRRGRTAKCFHQGSFNPRPRAGGDMHKLL